MELGFQFLSLIYELKLEIIIASFYEMQNILMMFSKDIILN